MTSPFRQWSPKNLESLQEWITPKARGSKYRQDIEFAHVEIDIDEPSDQSIWETVLDSACRDSDTRTRVWVVGPDTQTDIATLAWHQVNSRKEGININTATYQEFSAFLHDSRNSQGLGFYGSAEIRGWTFEDDTLQTVIIYIDPLMSAECALAMLGTVYWATVISDAVPVRILSISNAPHPESLSRLTDEDMIKTIERDLEKEETEQQIIVCYSPWDWTRNLPRKNNQGFILKTAQDDSVEDRLKHFDRVPARDILNNEPKQVQLEKKDYDVVAKDEACIMLQLPPGYRHPSPLAGFKVIHLCLSTSREQTIFDPYTEQMARLRLLTSEEERQEQVAMAFRTSRARRPRVMLYCDQGTIDHFVEFGASERRLRICNDHTPGFILALVCLKDWELDIEKILSLGTQRIIREAISEAEERLNFLGTRFHGKASLLLKLLPIVDFDYRLAVFIAHPTQSAKVFKVKLQLAAILVTGIEKLFTFARRGSMPYEEYKKSLILACQGWTSLLARTGGSMWLAVGLWKSGAAGVEDRDVAELSDVKIHGAPVTMNMAAFHAVQRTLNSLTNACALSYIPVLPDSLPENDVLSDSESDEIQEHLAWAYLWQVVQTERLPDGKIVHRLLNGTHNNYTLTLPAWAFDESDVDCLLGGDVAYYSDGSHDNSIFGIFHGMSREFGISNFYLDDWTYISGDIFRNAHFDSDFWDLKDGSSFCPRDPEEQKALSGFPE
ncbi:hypothetical protein FPRO04_04871 [Fusarium proliferatum]|nr:hypothetical protein FPRO04_04871 [Fusarium proliferatum]